MAEQLKIGHAKRHKKVYLLWFLSIQMDLEAQLFQEFPKEVYIIDTRTDYEFLRIRIIKKRELPYFKSIEKFSLTQL